jgi:hypothetical protein
LKQIRGFVKQLNDIVRNVEKELITNLDAVIDFKKKKLLESISFEELIAKKEEFMVSVEHMTEGLESLFNLEDLEKYIPYIDKNDAQGYLGQEGELLVKEIDNYCKVMRLKMETDIEEFNFEF